MRICLLLPAFFCFLSAFSQNKSFSLDIGLAKRFYPLSLANKNMSVITKPTFSVTHYQDFNLSIDISKGLLKNKLGIELSSYFRYGHSHYQRDVDLQNRTEIKKFKADLFLDVFYISNPTKGKLKGLQFKIGAGYGTMNMNTGYDYIQFDGIDGSGNVMTSRRIGGFRFSAPRLLLGVNSGRFNLWFNIHGTPDTSYEPYPTIWNELKLSYGLFRF